jgi:murein DD-endopeptidase MepM/ murein hydrolase activator NlpD
LIIFYTVSPYSKKHHELMTHKTPKVKPYPKSHILAASGVAALLSLALLVFPSREVEAKRTHLSPDFFSPSEQVIAPTESLGETSVTPSPFALTSPLQPTDTATTEPIQAPAEQATESPNKTLVVGNGDTLSTMFEKAGVSAKTLHEALASSKEAKQFTQLKVGQTLVFELDQDGNLDSLHSQLSHAESIRLSKSANGYAFKRDLVKPDIRQAYARGVIDSSLFLAAKKSGLSHSLTMDLANAFGYDIDFAMDIQRGDEFEVVFDEKTIDGKPVGSGKILAARFVNKGKTYTAVRYTNAQGQSSYYNASGNSMRKAFIRTPVDFARISSRFSNGRKHPILNKIRAHKGVDYAAPRGTPIKSAGDGKVLLAGRKGGYGNTVVIQHGQRYRTLYAHMQGFAKGIRNGSAVKQGQIIGYIGTTGLSTGPHLHYEFQVNGVHVDPLSQKLAMSDPLSGADKRRFQQLSQPLLARMDKERASILALNGR